MIPDQEHTERDHWSAQTRSVSHGINTDSSHGAVIPPLYLSSNYAFEGFNQKGRYDYSRTGNPTRDQFAGALAGLEGGEQAIVTSSGMSAVHLVTQLLRPGDLVLAPHDCYGGCHRLFTAAAARGHFQLEWLPLWETSHACKEIARHKPAMVWLETPSNPLLRITDIRAIAKQAHAYGALVVVDNTFLSPVGQRPIELGADIVIHSTTKYINGHSDVVGGAVIAREPGLAEDLAWWANCLGLTGAPFDSFLAMRGLRTLHLRYRQQQQSAMEVAGWLETHPAVSRVFYPGLESHAGHEVAQRQQLGSGAMLSFELQTDRAGIRAFLDALQLFTLAESLGGIESLIAHPSTMTHASMSQADQEAAGISDKLLRLSLGVESVEDLVADLEAGFANLEHHAFSAAKRFRMARSL